MNWRETTAQLVRELYWARMSQCCDGDDCVARNATELLQKIDEIVAKYKRLLGGRHAHRRG